MAAGESGLDQAFADGVANEPRRLVDVELAHDGRAVRIGRLHADTEDLGDLLRRLALGDELQDFALALAEPIGTGLRAACR
jgi:hypothetical protein